MTQPIDRVAQREFVENDDGYKLVLERHNKIHNEARSAKFEITAELRKIVMLFSAHDLCTEKSWEHEDIAEGSELDKQLKRLTPDGSDMWFSHYQSAAGLMVQQMVEQCKAVLMAEHAARKLHEEAQTHCDSLTAAREEAEKRYLASLEPVKRGPGRPRKTAN
tara:strand:- start:506 stop:994 length:489 start_codon:yes stop_codon:yes gene_type:complete